MTASSGASLVTTTPQLLALVEHMRSIGRFAFDTEFVSEDTFEPVLCLIQVATRERLALIDPLAVRDLDPFWDAVCDPGLEVVMHAAGEDLRICLLRTGRLPRRVFDVQIAAGLAGFSYPLSLVNLVAQVLGVSLAGGETRTDWRRRPLSPAQIDYALDDVRYLLELADIFAATLRDLGRTAWADEEFEEFIAAIAQRADEDRWRRLPGLNQLSRRGMEMARQLSSWREDEARRQNRPLRQVMRDDLLVAIAKRQPTNRRGLEALRDFNRPGLMNRADEILRALQKARDVPEDELPEASTRIEEPPGLSTVSNLLSAAMAQCCAQHRVAGSLAANVADLKQLIRWHLDGGPTDQRPALVQGWRADLFGRALLEVLDGRVALRVTDPRSDFPVTLEPVSGSDGSQIRPSAGGGDS
jgi:ribonuclease D